MKVVVGLPYLRDVRRKARSGCFGPFVRYGYFPSTYRSKGRKGTKFKEKGGRKDKKLELQKKGRKANREEKTQHN